MDFRISWVAVVAYSVLACSGLDAEKVDKDAGAVTDGSATQCQQCLEAPNQPGPGCANELAACQANALCADHLVCLEQQGCTALTTREEMFTCGTQCWQDRHVDINDPAVALGYAVYRCRITSCGSICYPGQPPLDAGPPPDQLCHTKADCGPGLYCCGTLQGTTYESIKCAATCAEANQYEFCDPQTNPDCHFRGTCQQSLFVSTAHICK